MNQDVDARSPTEWWSIPVIIALAALALRLLLLAAFPDGRDDLAIYVYYGRMFRDGLNPYLPPLDGPISPGYSDQPLLNLTIFATALRLWDSPTVLRVLFALVDSALILTLGYLVSRPQEWRLHAMLFWAFNPVVLLSMVVFTVDKVIVVLLLFLTFVAVEARKPTLSLVTTTLVALYRWLGALYAPALVLHGYRTWRARLLALASFAAVFVAVHIPFWPSSLLIYQRRGGRGVIEHPQHVSPTILLDAVGLYRPWMAAGGALLLVGLLYVLFLRRKVSTVETIVLSSFLFTMLSPELPVGRVVMVAFPIFLLITVSPSRMALLWVATVIAAPWANGYLADDILGVIGLSYLAPGGTVAAAVLANIWVLPLIAWYLMDKRRGLVSTDTLLPEGTLRWPATPTPILPQPVAADD